ncbi:VWA domain-containing protein [Clostridium sp. SHJSY1]|uniref:vWA domain-containing protein n=1 Tax=Clostridium sp. SHJSY1 TaxID=2942483 RepID=UPI0028770728|nr:vWA domain-containing protein [Clostridium sp. SHJSY1]MDS0525683.1 VWA domain-containing protein [Clostridium sp. SHJSY1]
MYFFKNKRLSGRGLFLVTFSLVVMISFMFVKAGVYKPNMTITYDSTIISGTPTTSLDIKGLVNQDVEIKYKVTPDSLAFGDVNTKVNKEIVLVLDTSGSMNDGISSTDKTIRIDALKVAATNFINNFKTESNVKIGIANYSTKANYNNLSLPLTAASTGNATLLSKINSYKRSTYDSYGNKTNDGNIEGGTNTGDGIRYALNMLNNGSTAKKFVVLMSDGEPTFYMKKAVYTQKQVWHDGYYTGYWWNRVWHEGYYTTETVTTYEYYTQLDDSSGPILDGPGNADDASQNCLNYASTMSVKIKDANYSSFNIAYSSGGSADKMKALATASGGKYFSALDANAINNVFSEIADQIKGTYAISGVNLKATLPAGIEYTGSMADVTIDGTTYTQKLPDLIYRLSSDKSKYITDPFYISFKFKATKSGTYSLPQNATLNYKGTDGNLISINLNQTINYVANDLVDEGTPLIKAAIVGQDPTPGIVGQDLKLKYSVSSETFKIFETTNFIKPSSYTIKAKLKFNLQGKFESGLGLNKSTDSNFEVETPEFDVVYKLDTSGSYVLQPIENKEFTVKIKEAIDIENLQFGPGIVSYIDLNNKPVNTNIEPYLIKMVQIGKFGMYRGIKDSVPDILENSSSFNIQRRTNIRLGATLTGSLNNKSQLRLEIANGLELYKNIEVYTYDDKGTLTLVGNMEEKTSTDTRKKTYSYNGKDVTNQKILILYNETISENAMSGSKYVNELYIGKDIKDVQISVYDGEVELF